MACRLGITETQVLPFNSADHVAKMLTKKKEKEFAIFSQLIS